jgi:hypothetical protein
MDAIEQLDFKLEGFDGRLEIELLNRALVKAGLPTSSSPIWKGLTLIANKDSQNKRYPKDGKKCYAIMKIVIARIANKKDFLDHHVEDAAVSNDISAAGYLPSWFYIWHRHCDSLRAHASIWYGREGDGTARQASQPLA